MPQKYRIQIVYEARDGVSARSLFFEFLAALKETLRAPLFTVDLHQVYTDRPARPMNSVIPYDQE